MVYVEGFRLIVVLAGVFGGFEVGSAVNSGPDAVPRVLGALLGALLAYVIGGMLGRVSERGLGGLARSLRRMPASELLAAIVVGGMAVLLGVLLTVPLFVLAYSPFDFLVAAAVAWLFGTLGARVGMAKGHQLAETAGLTRRLTLEQPGLRSGALLLDSSAVMDRSLTVLATAGLLPEELVVPEVVIDEVTTIANGPDPVAARRARRGLETLELLRSGDRTVGVLSGDLPHLASMDDKLIELARRTEVRVATCSAALSEQLREARLNVVDLRQLVADLAPDHVPGERLVVDLVRAGRQAHQAIGYLPDGDMVVVNDAEEMIGSSGVEIVVLSCRPTAQGVIVFARPVDRAELDASTGATRPL